MIWWGFAGRVCVCVCVRSVKVMMYHTAVRHFFFPGLVLHALVQYYISFPQKNDHCVRCFDVLNYLSVLPSLCEVF